MNQNILVIKSKEFALKGIKLYQQLQNEGEYILSKQFLRSSTSIGANIAEAIAGQSKKDFHSKICIAFKEAHETLYWLDLLKDSSLTKLDLKGMMDLCQELIRILSSTKLTTEKNLIYEKNNP